MAPRPENFVAPVQRVILIATPDDMGEPEDDPFFTVIWFDPGLITGWCVFGVWPEAMQPGGPKVIPNIAAWSAGEFYGSEGEIVTQMMDLVEAWSDGAHVGYEDFILRKLSMGRELLSPVRVSARLVDRMEQSGRAGQLVPPQLSHLAFSTITDERLKDLNFWNVLKGQKDARAAVKHALTYLRRYKEGVEKNAARQA